jgi:Domain of unknown function (DUF4331)
MSHHFDSPTAIEDGRLNLLDVYVFPEAPGTSTLVLTVNPDCGRSSPTAFRPDALYEFAIASDGGTGEDREFRTSFREAGVRGEPAGRTRIRPARPALSARRSGPLASRAPQRPSPGSPAGRQPGPATENGSLL